MLFGFYLQSHDGPPLVKFYRIEVTLSRDSDSPSPFVLMRHSHIDLQSSPCQQNVAYFICAVCFLERIKSVNWLTIWSPEWHF